MRGAIAGDDADLVGAKMRLDAVDQIEQPRLDGMLVAAVVAHDVRRAVEVLRREAAAITVWRELDTIGDVEALEHEHRASVLVDRRGLAGRRAVPAARCRNRRRRALRGRSGGGVRRLRRFRARRRAGARRCCAEREKRDSRKSERARAARAARAKADRRAHAVSLAVQDPRWKAMTRAMSKRISPGSMPLARKLSRWRRCTAS